MTAEIFRSDDPCAIARTLMPALLSAPKQLPAIPSRSIMPSPTIAMMQQPSVRSTVCTSPRCISRANVCSTVCFASAACERGTAKQIECSELACEIMTTETSTACSAPKSLWATPGIPIIPVPSTLIKTISSTAAKPFIGASIDEAADIFVPGASGLNVFLIQTVMLLAIAGDIVLG